MKPSKRKPRAKPKAAAKAGRPPLPEDQRRRPIEVTLPVRVIGQLRAFGDGNVSRGIERAAQLLDPRRADGERRGK